MLREGYCPGWEWQGVPGHDKPGILLLFKGKSRNMGWFVVVLVLRQVLSAGGASGELRYKLLVGLGFFILGDLQGFMLPDLHLLAVFPCLQQGPVLWRSLTRGRGVHAPAVS
jgi:hypothetical protein